MNPYDNQFKRALAEGRTLFGAWLMSGSLSTAEALGVAGFDFLVVDMEHTPLETHHMIDTLRTIAGTPRFGGRAHAVERHGDDQARARRRCAIGPHALRAGRRGGADARFLHALSARRVRGVAGMHRGNRYGTVPTTSSAGPRVVRDGADRDAWRRSSACRDRRGPGVDSIFIGPRTCRPRWAIWATSATRRAGNAAARAQQCQAARASRRASSAATPSSSRSTSSTATRGSPSAPTWRSW
jgi:hypothetical protein